MNQLPANFDFLGKQDAQLVRLGALAECGFKDDPNTCLIRFRQCCMVRWADEFMPKPKHRINDALPSSKYMSESVNREMT